MNQEKIIADFSVDSENHIVLREVINNFHQGKLLPKKQNLNTSIQPKQVSDHDLFLKKRNWKQTTLSNWSIKLQPTL